MRQCLSIRVTRRMEDSVRIARFYYLACIHHGRMGGDEFAVLLIEQAEGDVLRTAECILEAIRAPFPLQEGEARISSSVGVAFHSLEAATPARLLKNADVAMYRAKGEGRDRLWRYRPSTFSDSGYGRVF